MMVCGSAKRNKYTLEKTRRRRRRRRKKKKRL
jgi:hypothetical protein